jgi:thiamine pyrophosphate-dependent acetolactate synthase large subunit-like protein
MPQKQLVFGIGMQCTATMSLSDYLAALGYKALHWPEWLEDEFGRNLHAGNDRAMEILAPVFQQYEAFCDVPFPGLFKELDQAFPEALFILTVRSPQTWWRSLSSLWKLEQRRTRDLTPGEIIQYRPYAPVDMLQVCFKDADILMDKFGQHNAAAMHHFKDRPSKLLVVNIEEPEKAHRISAFLGKPVMPFPHRNARRQSVS